MTYSAATGLYRTFRWGKHLELFFLDERSFRSAKATAACSGDLAPTAPQAVRDAFATLAPGLRNPVSPACIAAIDDPSRTMLGARQYAAFTKAIAASKATWKVIVNEVPIQQYYALPYDRWEGYAAERERLLRFLQANVKNVVFLTTDTHANLVNEVRSKTLGGAPVSYGIWEVVTGPVATNTFAKEIDSTLGQRGAGTAIGALFFKPAPPNGMGMRCAALDTYSYAQVTVDCEASHRRHEGREGPAGARGDRRGMRPARPDRSLTVRGRRADYPHGRAPVAQWTERRTSNPRVAGSNPAGRIGSTCKLATSGELGDALTTYTSAQGGSVS